MAVGKWLTGIKSTGVYPYKPQLNGGWLETLWQARDLRSVNTAPARVIVYGLANNKCQESTSVITGSSSAVKVLGTPPEMGRVPPGRAA